MKRLTCILAALALLMLTYIPAQAEFKGTLQRDQTWVLEVASSCSETTAVTVLSLGRNLKVELIESVQPAATVQWEFPQTGRDVGRIIIEVDPGHNGALNCQATVRIVQGSTMFSTVCDGDCRMVLDVV
jgi:hypothetical protein